MFLRARTAGTAVSSAGRRAAALLLVFVTAKVVLVALRIVDGTAGGIARPAAVLGLLLHDVWAAAGCFVLDALLGAALAGRAAVAGWLLYAAVAAWAAINVPVARVFSTPLTVTMLGAAGTAIADSIAAYVTPGNAAALLAVGAAAYFGPRAVDAAWKRTIVRFRSPRVALGLWLLPPALVAALGPWALGRLDSVGLHRNAATALLGTSLYRVRAPSGPAPGALPPLPPEGEAVDLSRFAGAAAGWNVLWISLESTGAAYLRPWGGPPPPDQAKDPMPTVTALAERGWIFESAYAAHPESIKGLFAMICSASPAAHTGADRYTERAAPCSPLGTTLRAAGYRTALFHSGWFAYLGMQGVVDDRGFERLVDAGGIESPHRTSFGVDETATVEAALRYLDEERGAARPFFLMYLPIAGHHPYNAPGEPDPAPPLPRDSDIHAYLDDLHHGDRGIARLLEGLRARGLLERTLVLVVGDHGEAFGQHEGNFAHTLFAWEENVHVPLLLHAPMLTVPALRVPQVASTIDLAPTLLALLGLPRPGPWEGRSLLEGRPGVARFYVDQVVFTAGLRSGPHKLLLDMESGRARLYDLRADPKETHDRAEADPERAARYRQHLEAWTAAQRARFAR